MPALASEPENIAVARRFRPVLEARLGMVEARIHAMQAQAMSQYPNGEHSAAICVAPHDPADLRDVVLDLQVQQLCLLKAMERLATGAFGRCMHCGGRIPEALLEQRPDAALCDRCHAQGYVLTFEE